MRSDKEQAKGRGTADGSPKEMGGRIVKIDQSNKGKSEKQHRLDYNPIIKVPIKGV